MERLTAGKGGKEESDEIARRGSTILKGEEPGKTKKKKNIGRMPRENPLTVKRRLSKKRKKKKKKKKKKFPFTEKHRSVGGEGKYGPWPL